VPVEPDRLLSQAAEAPPLQGPEVFLRLVWPDDYEYLYALALSDDVGFRWRFHGGVPNYETFVHSLSHDVLAQFIVVARQTQERSGLIVCYDADLWSGYCHIGMVMPPELLRSGVGVEAATLFIDYLFKTWSFRKLYAESVAFCSPSVAAGFGERLTLEGTLKDHEYFDGQYWDQPILAIYRETWTDAASPGSWLRTGAGPDHPPTPRSAKEQAVPSTATPPPLATRRVGLRAMQPDDLHFLYDLATAEQVGFRWRFRGFIPSYETFVHSLTHDVLAQFLVVHPETGRQLGYVVAYRTDPRNRYTHIGIVMIPSLIGKGVGGEALILFVNYLFATWSLRKIYAEIPEFNYGAVASGSGRFFREEAKLRRHLFYGGNYWDQYVVAIYRDEWEAMDAIDEFLKSTSGPGGHDRGSAT
jgi:RimJ/RimL family protein N-acetyltransferase